jgi:hypothetical protein
MQARVVGMHEDKQSASSHADSDGSAGSRTLDMGVWRHRVSEIKRSIREVDRQLAQATARSVRSRVTPRQARTRGPTRHVAGMWSLKRSDPNRSHHSLRETGRLRRKGLGKSGCPAGHIRFRASVCSGTALHEAHCRGCRGPVRLRAVIVRTGASRPAPGITGERSESVFGTLRGPPGRSEKGAVFRLGHGPRRGRDLRRAMARQCWP